MRFWKLRQAEYSPYTLQCSPLRVSCTCPACRQPFMPPYALRSRALFPSVP